MRASTIAMIGITVVFGLLTVFVAQVWLNNQANLQAKNLEANKKPVAMQAVVVAKQPLRFGTEFNAGMLKEVLWPVDAMPSGAFSKIVDVLHGGRCVVLRGDYKRARERLDAAQRKDPGNKYLQNKICSSWKTATARAGRSNRSCLLVLEDKRTAGLNRDIGGS